MVSRSLTLYCSEKLILCRSYQGSSNRSLTVAARWPIPPPPIALKSPPTPRDARPLALAATREFAAPPPPAALETIPLLPCSTRRRSPHVLDSPAAGPPSAPAPGLGRTRHE